LGGIGLRKVYYTEEFRSQLTQLKKYLKTEFDKDVAHKVESDIKAVIDELKIMPEIGISIGERFGIDTHYLCFYVRHHYICYDYNDENVYILGMIHEKQKAITLLKRLLK